MSSNFIALRFLEIELNLFTASACSVELFESIKILVKFEDKFVKESFPYLFSEVIIHH